MKAKPTLKRIITLALGMALIMMLAVSVSCKKKDDTPAPTPTPKPTPVPVTSRAVFNDKPQKLMTDWEILHKQKFAAHNFFALGKGLVGEGDDPEIPIPFRKAGKTLWEIHDYIHTENEFKEIDDHLQEIQNQLNQLQTMIAQIGIEIQLQTNTLENFFTCQSINQMMTPLAEALDSAGQSNFGYYPVIARRFSADSATWYAALVSNSKFLPTYSNNQINPPGGGLPVMQTFYTNLNQMICTAPQTGYNGALHTFNKTLIPLVRNQYPNGMDSATAMKAYQILENYFMWIVGAQFQAANILVNCANVVDSNNVQHLAQSQWTAFIPYIKAEIAVFLTEVDYFVVNLDEYRTSQRWTSDVNYADYGIAPDNVFINVLARAQFLVNALYNGMGQDYPVMCGKIIVPYNYTYDGGTQPTTSLGLTSTKNFDSTAVQMTSWIPNTVWPSVSSSVSNCNYDFNWSVFTFGTLGVPDGGWNVSNNISVNFSDNYHPWAHSSVPQGTVSAEFHNPMDLNDVSTSYDTVHCMQFGYFSANWKWGFLYLRYDNQYWHWCGSWCPWQLQDYGIQNHAGNAYIPGCDQGYFNATAPYVNDCHSDWTSCVQDSYNQYFTFNTGNCFKQQVGLSEMAYNGPAYNYPDGQTCYESAMYNTIQAQSTISGNTAWFACQASSWYNFGSQFNCYGGTGYQRASNMGPGTNISNWSLFYLENNLPNSSSWANTVYWGGNFNAGQQMQVNFSFDLFVNKANYSGNVLLLFHPNTAVVFGGLGSLPSK